MPRRQPDCLELEVVLVRPEPRHRVVIARLADELPRDDVGHVVGVLHRLQPDHRIFGKAIGMRRTVTDRELRAAATHKVHWESLSLDSRRRILDPVLTPEFLAATVVAASGS